MNSTLTILWALILVTSWAMNLVTHWAITLVRCSELNLVNTQPIPAHTLITKPNHPTIPDTVIMILTLIKCWDLMQIIYRAVIQVTYEVLNLVTCWALPCLYNESWCWSYIEFGLNHSLCPDPCHLMSPETHWADSVQTLSPYLNHSVRSDLYHTLSPDPCHMLNSNHKNIVTPQYIYILMHDHTLTLRQILITHWATIWVIN